MPMKRPMAALMACAMLLPLAGCYGDDGPRGYGPPPPPPPGGYYDHDRPPPPPGGYYDNGAPRGGGYWDRDAPQGYDPYRDYRDEPGRDRVITRDDRVYRGSDGRYYCKRSDGTTGTVVGAIGGGVLGAILGGGGALGTILGAGGGALLGRSVDKGEVHCK
ncbi:glycine zipper 2TM domain-containing protein [Sphingomonas oryzagri]